MNVVLLALAAALRGPFLQVRSADLNVPQNTTAATDIAAGYEAQMAVQASVASTANATQKASADVQAFADRVVAETTPRLEALANATVNQVLAEAEAAQKARSAAANATAASFGVLDPHMPEIREAVKAYTDELIANESAKLANVSANTTAIMDEAIRLSTERIEWMNESAVNSTGVANFTNFSVDTAVDPHWGPLAVNSTNQSIMEVDRTRMYETSVAAQVQDAQQNAAEATQAANEAKEAAAAANAAADSALQQTLDNQLAIKAAAAQTKEVLAEATGSEHQAAESVATTR
jgi:hypothetical protein